MVKFAFCLDPNGPACAGIIEKGRRAVDPRCAKTNKDKKAREALRIKYQKEMVTGKNLPTTGIYPNFGLYENVPIREQSGIKIRKKHLQCLAEKIVRGIFYIESSIYIEPCYQIRFFVLEDHEAQVILNRAKTHFKEYAREPGIVVKRAIVNNDLTSVFSIEIWKRLNMYVVVYDS